MFAKPSVVFPDSVAWAVGYLGTALADRAESYASGVTVRDRAPKTMPTRLITVRDDGGPRQEVTKTASLALNFWATTAADAADLARLSVALLEAASGNGPVVGHISTSGPAEVPEESSKPHWFASVELAVRGTAL